MQAPILNDVAKFPIAISFLFFIFGYARVEEQAIYYKVRVGCWL